MSAFLHCVQGPSHCELEVVPEEALGVPPCVRASLTSKTRRKARASQAGLRSPLPPASSRPPALASVCPGAQGQWEASRNRASKQPHTVLGSRHKQGSSAGLGIEVMPPGSGWRSRVASVLLSPAVKFTGL
jgi:hypothetical protein